LDEDEKEDINVQSVYELGIGLFLYIIAIINIVVLGCMAICCTVAMVMGCRKMNDPEFKNKMQQNQM